MTTTPAASPNLAPLDALVEQVAAQGAPPALQQGMSAPIASGGMGSKKTSTLLIGAGVLIIVAGVVAASMYVHHENQKKKKEREVIVGERVVQRQQPGPSSYMPSDIKYNI